MNELTWQWAGGSRICDQCGWLVLAEKFYYVCIGCERTQDKLDILTMLGLKKEEL